ncbi:hypothetical protein BO94DRAFT_350923 [Aspergillus sclerotioniger CBS 115572]|uniref:Uncharacterized protein n=1 Tax=Aspergillus sclerotioniger CBS 115572 TaxID=1450535 RepID=A0A317XB41_9EURO|nr:hypothetical protein BO94DRAFT_350923 [Aspergillus sclerotioniger CBS 115572]PWY93740.1 hypothetical protein BO94DRAFT_350923 [Aspergillus sclerotioniger CBS 115572]
MGSADASPPGSGIRVGTGGWIMAIGPNRLLMAAMQGESIPFAPCRSKTAAAVTNQGSAIPIRLSWSSGSWHVDSSIRCCLASVPISDTRDAPPGRPEKSTRFGHRSLPEASSCFPAWHSWRGRGGEGTKGEAVEVTIEEGEAQKETVQNGDGCCR